MLITEELGPMLDAEDEFISNYRDELTAHSLVLTEKSEHDLRMGFRTKQLLDLALNRAKEGKSPITGK